MELENIMLSEVSQFQKDKGRMFSLMWKTDPNTNASIIIYTHTDHISKSGTIRGIEVKNGKEEKKERMIVNNTEIHHICVGTRHNETH
jgi:dTDP-4-dehydrorhamnose 3,5-epimerase-like enzyme